MPPRRKYPSDLINYHKRHKPDSPHSLRLPEDRIDRFVEIREGLCMSVADTLRFVIDAAESAVERAIADRRERVVTAPAEVEPLQTNDPNPDNSSEDPDYSSEDSGSELESDVDCDILAELGVELDDLTSPVTAMVMWEAEKSDLQQKLRETQEPAVCYVDARYDSSRSGFHGIVVFINQKTNLITEMVTLTRKEAGESWHIETAAIAKGIQALREQGVNIAEIIHDDNTAVDSLLTQTGIESQKDLWHKSKNLMGKFRSKLQDLKMSVKDSSVESAERIEELNLYTVKQLKDWAKGKHLVLGGNKSDLVKRIAEHLFDLPSMTGPVPEGRASRGRPLAYPELYQNDVAYKLKSWIYTCCRTAAKRGEVSPNILVLDIITAADHWAGLHDMCRILPGDRKCCSPDWDNDSQRLYLPESVTHKAVREFLEKRITHSKMKFYTKARENYHSETFHSVINKFAPKRIHWMKSHCARLAVAALDWNENIQRICVKVYDRKSCDTAVRKRPARYRHLEVWSAYWKKSLLKLVLT
ncbi:hypothetical protein R1sor_025797 [Riccia sorocarpa]|uniref:SAP domain-containing protein n=1 Tax=Riccia sorocarpa TaxID=122646 RepID=A0ABD3GDJ4_9MARC